MTYRAARDPYRDIIVMARNISKEIECFGLDGPCCRMISCLHQQWWVTSSHLSFGLWALLLQLLRLEWCIPRLCLQTYLFDDARTSWIRNMHAYNLENSQCGYGRDRLGYWTPNSKALFTRFIHRVLLQYLTTVSLFHSTAHSRREMKRDPIKRSKLPSNVTSLVAFWKHLSLPIDRSCIPRRHAVFALSYS